METREWFDLHAHPGQMHCSAPGAPAPLPGSRETGYEPDVFREAGMRGASFATVADASVVGLNSAGGISVLREFEPGEAYTDHKLQIQGLLSYAASAGLSLIRSAADLDEADSTGMFLCCEGAHFVEDELDRIDEAYADGVRSVGIVHYAPNRFGDAQTYPAQHGGLSDAGRDVVKRMNELRMVVDVAHATYETTLDVLRVTSSPIMLSHSHLADGPDSHPRLLSVEHARAVAKEGGVIGAWPSGVKAASLGDFADEILRLVEVVGVDSVGVGTDLDGNYRPVLTRYEQFDQLGGELRERGLTEDEAAKVLGGNAIALIREVIG